MRRPLRKGFVAAGALAAALAAGCGRPDSAPATIRLVDRLAEAEVDWPAGSTPPEKGVLGPPQHIGTPHPSEARALAIVRHDRREERDERISLVAPAGGRYRFEIDLPRRASLRFDLARLPGGRAEAPLRFVVRVDPREGAEAVAFDRELPAGPTRRWQAARVDLGRWGGERVSLELAIEGGGAGGWGAWAAPRIDAERRRDERPSIILISLDTLRADHLGCYGYARPTSPRLDAFAAQGIRFDHPISQAPWTRPSHRAMLGGLYPSDRAGRNERFLAVPLWHAGYRTIAATGGGQVDSRFGFGAGFEEYRVESWTDEPERFVEGVAASAPGPFFLFLHTFAIHEPYTEKQFADGLPRGRIGERFTKPLQQRLGDSITGDEKRYAEALYDGGIAWTDERVGRLLDAARAAGWLDRAIVVVTSDHGEQFWEHGTWGHGQHLYDHQLRVPLLVSLPAPLRREWGREATVGRVVGEQVRLVDLYPTLLELTGTPRPRVVAGRSLVPILRGGTLPPVEAFAENVNIRPVERKGLRTDRFKFILTFPRQPPREGREEIQLFDLRSDPGERVNLAERYPDAVRDLLERLARHRQGETNDYEEELPEDLDPELRKRLQALGYLGG
jgi:arylsulfatase A-like enzyme